jgi:hypothetical protein
VKVERQWGFADELMCRFSDGKKIFKSTGLWRIRVVQLYKKSSGLTMMNADSPDSGGET